MTCHFGTCKEKIFHIYEKATNKPVKVCMTIDELEQMLAEKTVDWTQWEIQPCYIDDGLEDHSY